MVATSRSIAGLVAALAVSSGIAAAQQANPALITNRTLINNQFIFGRNAASAPTLTQRVLDTTNRQLLGLGPADSVIRFPADGSVTSRAVWIGSSVPRGRVEGLEIDGQYNVGQGSLSNLADVAHGIESDAVMGRVQNNFVRRFRGAGVDLAGRFARNNEITQCFTGIKITTADCMVSDNFVYGHRDYGLHVVRDAGNNYSTGNHYFGCNNSASAQDPVANNGAACRIDQAGFFRGQGDIYADSYYGIQCTGWVAQFTNCHLFHNTKRAVYFTGDGCELLGCVVEGMARTAEYTDTVAVEFAAERCGMFDGSLELTNYSLKLTKPVAAEGLHISGDACRARTRLIDGDGFNGTKGVRIKSPIIGGDFHFWSYDFHQSNDRLLIVDNAAVDNRNSAGTTGMRGVTIHFWGVPTDHDNNSATAKINIDLTNPGSETAGIKKYVDIKSGWDSSNTIVLHDTSTGNSVTLTPNTAY